MVARVALGGGDIPTIGASNYASTSYGLHDFQPMAMGSASYSQLDNSMEQAFAAFKQQRTLKQIQKTLDQETEMTNPTRRFAQVIIVDPNENVPLDSCLVYKGDPKLTDATDQELFFELDIKDLLAKHNEKRIAFIDKKVKDRTENLEPAKVRDLKMVVVNIATF